MWQKILSSHTPPHIMSLEACALFIIHSASLFPFWSWLAGLLFLIELIKQFFCHLPFFNNLGLENLEVNNIIRFVCDYSCNHIFPSIKNEKFWNREYQNSHFWPTLKKLCSFPRAFCLYICVSFFSAHSWNYVWPGVNNINILWVFFMSLRSYFMKMH